MSSTQYQHVIVGGGIVAGYAARIFAENGAGSQLCILSADDELPYDRPALSKDFLAGEESQEDILINEADFYSAHEIDIRLQTVVRQIDFSNKRVQLQDDVITYDQLLIATGARPKTLPIPGFDQGGIHTLRTMDDARHIRTDARNAKRAVVIGGSFIGMEVGSVLQRLGVPTTLVFPEDRVWEAFFTPEMSRFFEAYYRDRGVEFVTGTLIEEFRGVEGRVAGVALKSGQELPANLVVAGVGVEPNVEFVQDRDLPIEDGILVNPFLETDQPGVFAAGDVARYRDIHSDKRRRFEHWDNAKNQGEHAARAMLGTQEAFRHVPYFFSDVFSLSYEFWGDTSAAATAVHRGQIDDGSFSTWWLDADNHLVAAFVMDRPDEEREAAPMWIREKAVLAPDLLGRGEALEKVSELDLAAIKE